MNKYSNFFLVGGGDGLTLIDTGGSDRLERLRSKFVQGGFNLDDLDRIVVTHSHSDHNGNLARLRETTGAKVFAHEAEQPFITGSAQIPRPRSVPRVLFHLAEPLFRARPCAVDVALQDGDVIAGPGLVVIHVPGHSPGSICLYHQQTRSLFAGDALVNRHGAMAGPISYYSSDHEQACKSVGRLAELDVETIYFGHGATIKSGAGDALKSLAASFAGS